MDVRAMADARTSILQRTYVHWLVHVRAFFLGRIKKRCFNDDEDQSLKHLFSL